MAGAAPTPSGKGGKKALDASINLVPFIDLLSCCICFLIMTAGWVQFKQLNTSDQSSNSQGTKDNPPQDTLNLFLYQDGYQFTLIPGDKKSLTIKDAPVKVIETKGEKSYDLVQLAKDIEKKHLAYPKITNIRISAFGELEIYRLAQVEDMAVVKFPGLVLGPVLERMIPNDAGK